MKNGVFAVRLHPFAVITAKAVTICNNLHFSKGLQFRPCSPCSYRKSLKSLRVAVSLQSLLSAPIPLYAFLAFWLERQGFNFSTPRAALAGLECLTADRSSQRAPVAGLDAYRGYTVADARRPPPASRAANWRAIPGAGIKSHRARVALTGPTLTRKNRARAVKFSIIGYQPRINQDDEI
jgi:hypothetical protein